MARRAAEVPRTSKVAGRASEQPLGSNSKSYGGRVGSPAYLDVDFDDVLFGVDIRRVEFHRQLGVLTVGKGIGDFAFDRLRDVGGGARVLSAL